MDLARHLERLTGLLNEEREAERARFDEARGQLSLSERESRGLALADVSAKDEGGLAGRSLVTYASSGRPLSGTRIGVSSPVKLTQRREKRDDEPRGVVARRTRDTLSVVFDEPPPAWATSGKVVVELEPSQKTFERLSSAVARMGVTEEGRRWQPFLSGDAPRFLVAARGPSLGNDLNPEQRTALESADRALDLALVHGPPGTGKTTVLVEVVRRAVARGERVLATAPSNLAVDNLAERLSAVGLNCVRIGHPARVLESLLDLTLEKRAEAHEAAKIAKELMQEAFALFRTARKRREKRGPGRFSNSREAERDAKKLLVEARTLSARAEAEVLDRAEVVLATLTSIDADALRGRKFALAAVDEATQAVEPALYLALLRAERAVLAGDHLQLPPTVLSAAAQAGGLAESLFERLMKLHGEKIATTLLEQHRMNARIMAFPSKALYGGALRAHESVADHTLRGDGEPLVVVDTSGMGHEERNPEGSDSRMNPQEAELVAKEVQRVLSLGVLPGEVAVISPYEGQVQFLRDLLAKEIDLGLEVDTVDGFQGREKEAVVVSLTRANADGEVGFLSDVRRMNVAITRARKKLVVVGDGATVCRHPFYEAYITHAQEVGAWKSGFERALDLGLLPEDR